ncbi:MAG: hypothetical protein AMXMBFR64_47160 [Myxococcales bacterium]
MGVPYASVSDLPRTVDVIVAGGGFIGSVVASALAREGRRVAVVEAKPGAAHKRLAGELMHPAGVAILERLGLLGPLHGAGAIDVHGFAVFPGSSHEDPTLLRYDEIRGVPPRGLAIPHHVLVETLRERAAAATGVTWVHGRVEAPLVSQGRVFGARLAGRSGEPRDIYATLLVVADGRHSRVRKALGLDPDEERISFSGGATVPASALPVAGHGHIFLGAWGPVLAYPISATEARMVFDLPPDFSEGRRDRLAAHLREQYVPLLPAEFRPAVEAAIERPDQLQIAPNYRMAAERVWLPGAVLVGDACGCAHPMTAAGMTNGLNDVRHLLAGVDAYLDGGGRDDAPLRRYQRDRRPFFETRALLARALYEVFRSPEPGAGALRGGVFRSWEASPHFRRATLGLLGGDTTSPAVFAREYLRVVAGAMGRTVAAPSGGRLRTLLDIGRHSVAHLDPASLGRLLRSGA